jgi:membrane fusion protein (multidrug efflux system)
VKQWTVLVGIGGVLALSIGAYIWNEWRWLESTDNAYIGADIEPVAAKIAGYAVDVPVVDNQSVEAGTVLVRLDRSEYESRVAQARAAFDSASANLTNLDAQAEAQAAQIRATEAERQAAEAETRRARLDRDRFNALARGDNVSRQRLETVEADLAKAQAALARTQAAIGAAQGQLNVIETSRPGRAALVAQAKAALDLALDDLSHTEIKAGVDGLIGRKSVVPGQYVRPGSVLMSVVPIRAVFIDANFKETQLTRMVPGQKVKLLVDAYPDVPLTGTLVSLAPASGALFSLLPPENATGNFTKVVQRVPVRIKFDDQGVLAGKLRPGLSVKVTVDTRSGPTDKSP